MALDEALRFYDAHVGEWQKTNSGDFVVIMGEKVLGFYKTEDDALAAGAAAFGATQFLVRKIGEAPQQFSAPALAFGILRANA
jgi:hypothetical protein